MSVKVYPVCQFQQKRVILNTKPKFQQNFNKTEVAALFLWEVISRKVFLKEESWHSQLRSSNYNLMQKVHIQLCFSLTG